MLDGLPVGTYGPGALAAIAVLMLFTGRLATRSQLDDIRKDRDSWRTAHETSEKARAELALSVHDLLEHAKTTDAFIRSLPHQPPQQVGGPT